ncbi:FAD-binding oxidoreductase [Roseomonas nepalensis]|uniref:FAD-binding oxidoreductase n=1 Tax=Muricoccus nepalensis TaxID=1854500 RepID=A0A502FAE6_9PROT|nr:FAD-binding oxidoreductase [Roseomonas nepalensis]
MPFPLLRVESDAALPAEADVVVVGGGIVGVAAAYYLAREGQRVALVEKGWVGAEQSGRNWGWVRQQNRDERELPLARHSLGLWGGLDREIGADLGFRRDGLLYVTDDAAELAGWERWVGMARGYQVHSRMLGAAEAAARVPGGARRWLGGVESPSDGRAEPTLAAPALARAARREGATLHQSCAVRGLETTGGAVSAVVTERGTIRAARVLVAAGAWSSLFLRWHGIPFPQTGVRATAFCTEPAPGLFRGGLSTPGFTVGRRIDGRYTVSIRGRGRIELTPQGLRYARQFLPMFRARWSSALSFGIGRSFFAGPEALARWTLDGVSPFERTRVLDPAADEALVRAALTAMAAEMPALRGLRVAHQWGGWIDSTPDAIPVISAIPARPGLFLASGFSGHGFGIGPGAGRLAADLITGRAPSVDPRPFRHARFAEADLGAPAAM